MTQTTQRASATSTANTQPRTLEKQMVRGGKTLLNKLAQARMTRLLAERVEKPLKEKLKDFTDEVVKEFDLKKDDVVVVKTNDTVVGKITLRDRGPKVDYDLLLQAFPEAYEACVSRNVSPQFDTV